MTQVPNYTVEDSTGAGLLLQLTDLFKAVQSLNSGPTAPSDPVPGMCWRDTSVNPSVMRVRNDTNTAWVDQLTSLGAGVTGVDLLESSSSAAALSTLGVTATAAQINPLAYAPAKHFLVSDGANLVAGAADFADPLRWSATQSNNGITASLLRTEIDPLTGAKSGVWQVTGTCVGSTSFVDLYRSTTNPKTPAVAGQKFTASVIGQIIDGTPPPVAWDGLRTSIAAEDASSVYVNGSSSETSQETSPDSISVVHTVTGAATQVRGSVQIRTSVGNTANYTVKVSEFQLDAGEVRQTYAYRAASPADARTALGVGGLIRTVNIASDVAAVDFTSQDMDLTRFSDFYLVLRNVRPVTTAYLFLRASYDGGATFAGGATDYAFALDGANSTPVQGEAGSSGVSALFLTLRTTHASAGGGVSGEVKLFGCDVPRRQKGTFQTAAWRSDSIFERTSGGFMLLADAPVNGLRIFFSTGNIAADDNASISIYGVPK